ncbi:glycoside hydrolase family 104 protein [Vogesella sp. GCM10023246]|uniref:Glycoside hydrolase family 104 protein n=1 Tax=Vogesella oryzagri TaxID=3160864 RepID=A0ABV1M875_9NEIS
MARISEQEAGGRNVLAFLDMIAVSELGRGLIAASDDGYNVIVGSTVKAPLLFRSYSDHPRRLIDLPKLGIKSTAAGRYQVLARYYDAYRKQLGLSNFGAINQDRIALQMIRECRALDDILRGNIAIAISKCRSRWASLPGAGYGQNEHSAEALLAAYATAGGRLA